MTNPGSALDTITGIMPAPERLKDQLRLSPNGHCTDGVDPIGVMGRVLTAGSACEHVGSRLGLYRVRPKEG